MRLVIATAAGVLMASSLWLFAPSASAGLTFAEVTKRLAEAKTVSYRVSVQDPQSNQTLTHRCWFRASDRMRIEQPDGYVTVIDLTNFRSLGLDPNTKQAFLQPAQPQAGKTHNGAISDTATELKRLASRRGEPAGERDIGGVRVPGFKVAGEPPVMVWADPKTGLPARIEMEMALNQTAKTTLVMDEFQFDMPLADDFFPLTPPADYKVVAMPNLLNEPLVKHVAELLRAYAAKHDGNFPKKLDDWVAYQSLFTADQKDGELSPAALTLATRLGVVSAGLSMTRPADQGYHGDGVKLGAKDVIIFWHRDAPTQVVSAVFGDLRTGEVAEEQLPKKR